MIFFTILQLTKTLYFRENIKHKKFKLHLKFLIKNFVIDLD